MDYLQKSKENFYNFIKKQNIIWDLSDKGIIIDDTEVKIKPLRDKKKANIEIVSIIDEYIDENITYVETIDVKLTMFGKTKRKSNI